MILNTFWTILLILIAIYYLYVVWILWSEKKSKRKKIKNNDSYLQINDNFVNESQFEQTDLETILNQTVDEVENNSKLLEAFKKGSKSADLNNSLTRKKDEKFKVIRNKDVTKKDDSDSGT